jgi:hypothetical protein
MSRGAPGTVAEIKNAALFAELVGQGGDEIFDMLESPAQTQGMVEKIVRQRKDFAERSESGYPCVRITDLQSEPGDEVSYDMLLAKRIKPVMGDASVEGRGGSTTFAEDKLAINQFVFPWDSGGKMTQKRTRWKLRPLSRVQAVENARAYLAQVKQVHLAGARGDNASDEWIWQPGDPDESEMLVNPIQFQIQVSLMKQLSMLSFVKRCPIGSL